MHFSLCSMLSTVGSIHWIGSKLVEEKATVVVLFEPELHNAPQCAYCFQVYSFRACFAFVMVAYSACGLTSTISLTADSLL